ncbi:MAG: GNAT family N-acetyltransferase [Anaerolineae bacterium]
MTTGEILALYDAEMRRDPFDPFGRVEKLPDLTRVMMEPPGRHGGWILYTRLSPETADEAIATQIADMSRHMETAGRGLEDGDGNTQGGIESGIESSSESSSESRSESSFEWKVFDHDTPADLKQRLIAHGFEPDEPEALMALDLEEAPARLLQPVSADILRITDPAQLSLVAAVQAQVWEKPTPGLEDELAQTLRTHPDLMSIFQAYADDKPVANARICYHPGRRFADLWGGSTLPAYRGRGIYTALVAVRAQEARTRGVRFLTVDASPMSRPILQKLGFRHLVYTTPFVWTKR